MLLAHNDGSIVAELSPVGLGVSLWAAWAASRLTVGPGLTPNEAASWASPVVIDLLRFARLHIQVVDVEDTVNSVQIAVEASDVNAARSGLKKDAPEIPDQIPACIGH